MNQLCSLPTPHHLPFPLEVQTCFATVPQGSLLVTLCTNQEFREPRRSWCQTAIRASGLPTHHSLSYKKTRQKKGGAAPRAPLGLSGVPLLQLSEEMVSKLASANFLIPDAGGEYSWQYPRETWKSTHLYPQRAVGTKGELTEVMLSSVTSGLHLD